MIREIKIISVSIFISVLVALFIFGIQASGITGFAVLDEEDNMTEVSFSEEDSLVAMDEAVDIIEEMRGEGFSVLYLEDILLEMRLAFETAGYAAILRDEVLVSDVEKNRARAEVGTLDWREFNYGDVVVYLGDFEDRREKAFLLFDRISIEELKIVEGETSEDVLDVLDDARVAFYGGRYGEVESFLDDFSVAAEFEKSERSVLAAVNEGVQGFFQKYWLYVFLVLIFVGFIFFSSFKIFVKMKLKARVAKLKIELKVLDGLIRKAQFDRFKHNSISGLVYNIRVKKYGEKSQLIKEELPVLEARLTGKKKVVRAERIKLKTR